jgi:hypothetical protein
MNFDLGKQNAAPGTKLTVKTVKFEEKSVLLEDSNGTLYRSYYDKQPLWQTEGMPYLGVVGATLWGVVGDSTTPGGYLRFFVRKFISLPEPQQPAIPFDASNDVPRSPYDVVSKQLDETMKSIGSHRPQPKRPRSPMGKASLPPEETTEVWNAADKMNETFSGITTLCVREGRTPQGLLKSRGLD